MPGGLPSPVERFYRALYGQSLPHITSAVVSGRARLRISGLTFPARFRFSYIAGQSYRHYIEATIFGLPVMKVNEHYLEGHSRLELPFGVVEHEPKVDQAANLGLWGESIWLPAICLTDPRASWLPVDQDTALLRVPFGQEEQTFLVRFDPRSGLLSHLEAMRYRDASDEAKTLWINEVHEWRQVAGHTAAAVASVTWFDQGKPWAVFTVEQLVYNVDLDGYIRNRGA
jgi:hypothetical protein